MNYYDVHLSKLRVIVPGDESQIVMRSDDKEVFYIVKEEWIENFYTQIDAIETFEKYIETDKNVFAYKIIGPEHGHGESTFIESEIDGIPEEFFETEKYDSSPQFQFMYNTNKELIASYFFDKDKPGGTRLDGEIELGVNSKVWMLGSYHIGNEDFQALIPVIILGKGELYEDSLNIEEDGLKVRPLLTVKCNWGEYPEREGETIPRIDLFPLNIISKKL